MLNETSSLTTCATEPTELDWAQLAAYIDGEGSIVISKILRKLRTKNTMRYSLHIQMGNTHPRLAEWCKEKFGGSTCYMPRKGKEAKAKHRGLFYWSSNSQKAAAILRKCLPHFKLKRDQAELGITFQESLVSRKHTTPEILAQRDEQYQAMRALKHIRYEEPTKD